MNLKHEWLVASGAERITLQNPASPKNEVATRPVSTMEDIVNAVRLSVEAQRGWRESSVAARASVLRKTGDILLRDEEKLAKVITSETGKHLRDSLSEVRNAAAVFHYYAGRSWNAIGEILPSTRTGVKLSAIRVPVGVVAVISPWNFPVNLLTTKLAPALAMGNAVAIKPSTIGAGASLILIEALYEAGLPEHVVNIILGDGSVVGDALIKADGISAVSFTGSTAVGRRVAMSATNLGRRYLCEMGGKNAAVVMSDADLDLAIETLIPAVFSASGQKCTATSRIIVESNIASEFTERFVDRVKSIQFGDPLDEGSYSGPVVSKSQFLSIVATVENARSSGQRLLTNWKLPNSPDLDGYFVPPTVFDEVAPDSMLFQDEIFGPVVSITKAKDLRTAVDFVNDSVYGLSASIFTRSLDAAALFEQDVACGVVNVNLPTTGIEFQSPFAGWKGSGTSYQEQGDEAFSFYTAGKTVAVRTAFP